MADRLEAERGDGVGDFGSEGGRPAQEVHGRPGLQGTGQLAGGGVGQGVAVGQQQGRVQRVRERRAGEGVGEHVGPRQHGGRCRVRVGVRGGGDRHRGGDAVAAGEPCDAPAAREEPPPALRDRARGVPHADADDVLAGSNVGRPADGDRAVHVGIALQHGDAVVVDPQLDRQRRAGAGHGHAEVDEGGGHDLAGQRSRREQERS